MKVSLLVALSALGACASSAVEPDAAAGRRVRRQMRHHKKNMSMPTKKKHHKKEKQKKGGGSAKAGKPPPTPNILPHLEGEYLGDFYYQSFDAETNTLSERVMSNDRPITIYRNDDYDAFVAYEYNDNGVANMGSLDCSQGKHCTALLKANLPYSAVETWTILDDGETIESRFLSQRSPEEAPVQWIGTFKKKVMPEGGLGGGYGGIFLQATRKPEFSIFAAAATVAGLADTLSGAGPYTVFVPTDAAFEDLPAGTLEDLLQPENLDALVKVLKYHVVSGKLTSSSLESGKVVTLSEYDVFLNVSDNGVKVNDATVTESDILASNGIIHVIDTVLIPEGFIYRS